MVSGHLGSPSCFPVLIWLVGNFLNTFYNFEGFRAGSGGYGQGSVCYVNPIFQHALGISAMCSLQEELSDSSSFAIGRIWVQILVLLCPSPYLRHGPGQHLFAGHLAPRQVFKIGSP